MNVIVLTKEESCVLNSAPYQFSDRDMPLQKSSGGEGEGNANTLGAGSFLAQFPVSLMSLL